MPPISLPPHLPPPLLPTACSSSSTCPQCPQCPSCPQCPYVLCTGWSWRSLRTPVRWTKARFPDIWPRCRRMQHRCAAKHLENALGTNAQSPATDNGNENGWVKSVRLALSEVQVGVVHATTVTCNIKNIYSSAPCEARYFCNSLFWKSIYYICDIFLLFQRQLDFFRPSFSFLLQKSNLILQSSEVKMAKENDTKFFYFYLYNFWANWPRKLDFL